jgi:hypothetical protein
MQITVRVDRMAASGTSRQFAAQHKLGSDWGRSGHVAMPASYQSDATDPKRTSCSIGAGLFRALGHMYIDCRQY